jgi:hypothetical protein
MIHVTIAHPHQKNNALLVYKDIMLVDQGFAVMIHVMIVVEI